MSGPTPSALAQLHYERAELHRAIDRHLRARDHLDRAGSELADEMIRQVQGWEAAGLLSAAELPLPQSPPAWVREYQRFKVATKTLESAREAYGLTRSFTSPRVLERSRCCLRDSITAVIESGWRLARALPPEGRLS